MRRNVKSILIVVLSLLFSLSALNIYASGDKSIEMQENLVEEHQVKKIDEDSLDVISQELPILIEEDVDKSAQIKAQGGVEAFDDKAKSPISISRFSIYTSADKFEFYTGEEVLFYLGLSLTEESGNLTNSTIEITVPKDYILKNSVEASNINAQVNKKVVEENDHYKIVYDLKTLSSGMLIDIPIKYKISKDTTPNNSKTEISAIIKGQNGTILKTSNVEEFMYKVIEPSVFKQVEYDNGLRLTSDDNKEVEMGKKDIQDNTRLSTNLNELTKVGFTFRMEPSLQVNKNFGTRYYDKIEIVDKLPQEAVFIQEDNPKWTYDETTHTARYTYENTSGLSLGSKTFLNDIKLYLKFPGAKIGEKQVNNMEFTLHPKNKGEAEELIVKNDDITFVVKSYKETSTFVYSKKSIGTNSIYDYSKDKESLKEWILYIQNEAHPDRESDLKLENVKMIDRKLDSNFKMKYITFKQDRTPHGTVSVSLLLKDKSVVSLADNIDVTKTQKIAIPDDYQLLVEELRVTFDENTYLNPKEYFEYSLFTEFIDKETRIVPEDKDSIDLLNYGNFSGEYSNGIKFSRELSSSVKIYSARPNLEINKTQNKDKATFFIDDTIKFNVEVKANNFEAYKTVAKTSKIVDLLPEGLEYVEDSARLMISSDKIIIDMEKGNNPYEPEVIYNFKDTGRTALVWDVKEFSFEGEGLVAKYREIPFSLTYQTKVGPLMTMGKNTNDVYLVWDNTQEIKSKDNKAEDIYDLNENGQVNDFIALSSVNFTYEPPKELMIRKEVKGSLDKRFIVPPSHGTSELGKEVTYKMILFNNSISDINTLHLLDVFPSLNDKTVSDDLTLENPTRVPRESTMALKLKQAVTVKEGYEVFYNTQVLEDNQSSADYYNSTQWTQTVDNFNEVKAIKIVLKEGKSLKSGEEVEFDVVFELPSELEDLELNSSKNSFGVSTSNKFNFFESNISEVKLKTYQVSGHIFEDTNDNHLFDSEDEVFKGYKVTLLDLEGKPVLNSNQEAIHTYTDEKGFYKITVTEAGTYRISVETPKQFKMAESSEVDLKSGSHLLKEYNYTESFTFDTLTDDVLRNAGFVRSEIDYTVNKVWVNGPDVHPEIEIQLYRNGVAFERVTLKDKELSHTFKDLLKTDEHGVDYVYTVDELTDLEHYTKEVNEHTITNTYVSPTMDYTVNKVWVNGPDVHPEIEIQLYRNGVAFETVTLKDKERSHTFKDLLKTDENGVDYIYTVDELTDLEHYTKEVNEHTITNTYVSPTMDYTVNKVWVNGPDVHPEIEIQLYRNGVSFETVTLKDKERSHTFKDLLKTDQKGVDYIYTVDELTDLENYTKEVNENTITNTYVSPTMDYTVNKVWVNGPDVHPEIEIQLYRNGVAFERVTLKDKELSHTFKDLLKTDEHGVDYVYTVDELTDLEHYTKEVNEHTITNTYVSPTMDYTVNKVWVNGPDVHPDIEIQLYRNGVAFERITLKDKELSHTFKDLLKTDEHGVDYVYTVDELTDLEHYTKEVNENTITNTYVEVKAKDKEVLNKEGTVKPPITGVASNKYIYLGVIMLSLFVVLNRRKKS